MGSRCINIFYNLYPHIWYVTATTPALILVKFHWFIFIFSIEDVLFSSNGHTNLIFFYVIVINQYIPVIDHSLMENKA